jgi:pantetheine-phosphate adenylyltransferase
MKLAYIGSFDPPTIGHLDIIIRASKLGDLVIGIGINSEKKSFIPVEERIKILDKHLKENQIQATITSYTDDSLGFLRRMNIKCIVRGLRNTTDFNYEYPYTVLYSQYGLETIFLFSRPEHIHVSSSLSKDLIKHNFDNKLILS